MNRALSWLREDPRSMVALATQTVLLRSRLIFTTCRSSSTDLGPADLNKCVIGIFSVNYPRHGGHGSLFWHSLMLHPGNLFFQIELHGRDSPYSAKFVCDSVAPVLKLSVSRQVCHYIQYSTLEAALRFMSIALYRPTQTFLASASVSLYTYKLW